MKREYIKTFKASTPFHLNRMLFNKSIQGCLLVGWEIKIVTNNDGSFNLHVLVLNKN